MQVINKKSIQKNAVRQQVGWIYEDLPWLSKEKALQANQQRDELLKALSGWVRSSFNGSKLHSGDLSPGCSICGQGGWGCNYINKLCNRNCFFCPQDRSVTKDAESQTDGISFKNPSEHVFFLKTFYVKGVAFSGGEPLLVLDRLLAHIDAIRREFGESMYLWAYTNGDMVNRASLSKLQHAGLNELRFDLSARGYDLSPIRLAKEYIPTVTVEIPAIPEDFDRVAGLLFEMETIGVNFLNLHQLWASEYNYKALTQRNYHFLHDTLISVFESEITALKLLVYAREQQIGLPINYCCSLYKHRFQGRGDRTRLSRVIQEGFEELTDAAYIRSLKVLDSTENIEKLESRLKQAAYPDSRWQCNKSKTEIAIHSSLLSFVDWSSATVQINYFDPRTKIKAQGSHQLLDDNLMVTRELMYQKHWSKSAIDSWQQLYVQKMSQKEVLASFLQNYPRESEDFKDNLQREAIELLEVKELEEVGYGFLELY